MSSSSVRQCLALLTVLVVIQLVFVFDQLSMGLGWYIPYFRTYNTAPARLWSSQRQRPGGCGGPVADSTIAIFVEETQLKATLFTSISDSFFEDLVSELCTKTTLSSLDLYTKIYIGIHRTTYTPELARNMLRIFKKYKHNVCESDVGEKVNLRIVKMTEERVDATSQLVMQAYMEDIRYYLVIRGGIHILSNKWPDVLLNKIKTPPAPDIGAVGNAEYLFFSKYHIDIFGYYYPTVLQRVAADVWMRGVYSARDLFRNVSGLFRVTSAHTDTSSATTSDSYKKIVQADQKVLEQ